MGNKNSVSRTNSDDNSAEFEVEDPESPAYGNKKLFEEYECCELSSIARAMYIDKQKLHKIDVRGSGYLDDRKKIHPGNAVSKLMLLELYEVESKDGDRHDHIAIRGLAKQRREAIQALPGNPEVIMINFQIPGSPPVSVVAYFALPASVSEKLSAEDCTGFESLLRQFLDVPTTEEARIASWAADSGETIDDTPNESPHDSSKFNPTDGTCEGGEGGDGNDSSSDEDEDEIEIEPAEVKSWFSMAPDIVWPSAADPGTLPPHDFHNMRFKLIPKMTHGPWIVRTAVPSQPALLGRKVVQRYFRGEGYMEIDVHIGSSAIASKIVGLCRGYTKHCAVDIGIVIQGEHPTELPERMLGCVCFNRIDMEVRQKLD